MELIILGTGNAQALNCFNTCFALRDSSEYLLVDTGGGNGILKQLNSASLPIFELRYLYLTHPHTDHVLGVPWVVRMVATAMRQGQYSGNFVIFCHDQLIQILEPLCKALLPSKFSQFIGTRILFTEIRPGDTLDCLGMKLHVFDVASPKAKQYGFRAVLPDGQTLTCLGDESYHPEARKYVENCDWLLTEAFCLYGDRDVFHPYEKNHSTVLDASRVAQELHVKHLVLYHTEDKTLATRKERYTAEASSVYPGTVFVPDDLDVISLKEGAVSL